MNKKSIYKFAADAGVPIGLYLTLMSACLMLSVKNQILASLILPLAIIFPFYLGWFIKKIGKTEPSYMKFSSLWLGGIYSVIFGTLICMLLTSLYVVFIEPGFVQLYFANMIESLEVSPFAEEYSSTIDLLKNAMEAKLLPSGLDFVMSMGWFTCFAGSLLSLIIAFFILRGANKIPDAVS